MLKQKPLDKDNVVFRHRFHIVSVFISASIWALSIFWLFPSDHPFIQVLYVSLLIGLVSTGLNLISNLPYAFPVFLYIIIGSLFIKILMLDASDLYKLNIALIIYIIYCMSASRAFRKAQLELIDLCIKLLQHNIQAPLTGIKNRRYFDKTIDSEWKRNVRQSNLMTMALVDIDLFKEVNDDYGHPVGDEVLIAVAEVIEKNMEREGEFVSRVGGEEFAIVIPNGDEQASLPFIEKIRQQISELQFTDNPGNTFSITASFGVACTIPSLNKSHEQLFKSADKALYQAKHEGRNCTRIYQKILT